MDNNPKKYFRGHSLLLTYDEINTDYFHGHSNIMSLEQDYKGYRDWMNEIVKTKYEEIIRNKLPFTLAKSNALS